MWRSRVAKRPIRSLGCSARAPACLQPAHAAPRRLVERATWHTRHVALQCDGPTDPRVPNRKVAHDLHGRRQVDMAQSAAAVALAETPTHSGWQRSAALGPPAGARARAGSQPKPGELRSSPHRLRGALVRRSIAEQSSPRSAAAKSGGWSVPGRAAVARCQWRDDLKLASTERASLRRQWRAHAARRSARRPDVGTAYLRRRRWTARRWTASCSCAPQTSQA